jgi:hypothetical protein
LEKQGIKTQSHAAAFGDIGPLGLTESAEGKNTMKLEEALKELHEKGAHHYFQKTKDRLTAGANKVAEINQALRKNKITQIVPLFPMQTRKIHKALDKPPVVMVAMATHSGVGKTGGQLEEIARALGTPMEQNGGTARHGEGIAITHQNRRSMKMIFRQKRKENKTFEN